MKIIPRENGETRREERMSLFSPRVAFLARGDFHARSRYARSTIPDEKWALLVV